MKTSFLKICALTIIISLTNCNDKAKEAKTSDAETAAVSKVTATTYNADAKISTIEWKGFKPTGSHNGIISIANGTLSMNDNAIESGNFTIDMKTITVTDIPAEKEANANLVGHLSNEDFFDVEKYPTAKFEVTGLETVDGKTTLSGNLTMKDATNNISFPVTTTTDGDAMKLVSETFTIDRSKWNIEYRSKSFFDDLGDKFINDDIELKVTLFANKA